MLRKQLSPTAHLVGLGDIKQNPIAGWQEFLKEGEQFLATALNGYTKRRQVFTAEILYNLVGMAIEKLLMAVLMKSGNLPYNHTMHDLVEAMEEFLPGQLAGLADELKALDGYQEICDIESYSISPPAITEVGCMLELAEAVKALAITNTTN